MRRRVTTVLATICVALAAAAVSNAAQRERHPQIRKAIVALDHAKADLQNAEHDYCGHRAEALEAVNRALEQLKKALDYDKHEHASMPVASSTGVDSELTGVAANGEKMERHPNIYAAIRALEGAKNDLQHAAHDFGGHRDEAVEVVEGAIKQLRQATACDKK
jgi:hypothetical protein